MRSDVINTDDCDNRSAVHDKLLFVAFFALCVMVASAPITQDGPSGGDAASMAEGSPIRQVAYLIIFLLILFGSRTHHNLRNLSAMPVNIYAVLGYSWLSIIWAIDPSIAIRRLALTTILATSTAIAIKLLGSTRTIASIRIALLSAVMASYVVVLIYPSVGIHVFEVGRDAALIGNWRGIYPEKNFMGAICALTMLVFFFGEDERTSVLKWIAVPASFMFLIMTESKTSTGLVLLALLSAQAFRANNHRNWPVVFVVTTVVAFCLVVVMLWYGDSLIAPLDRDDTLTGRSQIWRVLIAYIADHWLLGAGYGSFWYIGAASPVYDYSKGGSWLQAVSQGHNGYLDIASQIGLPGLAFAVYFLMIKPIATLMSCPGYTDKNGALYMSVLVFCVGHNFTESTLLARDHILQFMIVVVICLMTTSDRACRTR